MFISDQSMSAVLESKLYPGAGIIHSVVTPGLEWVVRVNGVYWTARAALADYTFKAGDSIRPIDRQGNTLLIEPA
jgi:membrane protein implicated in regulation of membrane protease activity